VDLAAVPGTGIEGVMLLPRSTGRSELAGGSDFDVEYVHHTTASTRENKPTPTQTSGILEREA
jgi:hypothetical protein